MPSMRAERLNGKDSRVKARSRRRLGARYNARFDDDDYELGVGRDERDNPTSAGMIGFIIALVSLGLLLVVGVLWYFKEDADRQQLNDDRTRWMLYWFMFLDGLSFFLGLAATIFGGRGLTPSNPLYRGFSLTALILGILEMLTTAILFIVLFCAALLFQVFRAG